MAQILFIENPAESDETLHRVKVIVLKVLTENQMEEPLTFREPEKLGIVSPKKGA
jgi:hypothetical protein